MTCKLVARQDAYFNVCIMNRLSKVKCRSQFNSVQMAGHCLGVDTAFGQKVMTTWYSIGLDIVDVYIIIVPKRLRSNVDLASIFLFMLCQIL